MFEREFKTTFFEDFTIADSFGNTAIVDTFKRAFKEWKDDVKYFTEFVVALNWKLWEWHDKGDMERARLYERLRGEADLYAQESFTGKDAEYFFKYTD